MKNRSLDCRDNRFRECPAENVAELFGDSPLGTRGCLLLRKNIEGELGLEDFAFDLLKVQEVDRLLLKFVHAGGTALRGGLENSDCGRLHDEFVVQVGQDAAQNNRCRMRIHVVAFSPKDICPGYSVKEENPA